MNLLTTILLKKAAKLSKKYSNVAKKKRKKSNLVKVVNAQVFWTILNNLVNIHLIVING